MTTVLRRAKRWLYLVHRWLGIAGCLMFAVWFASGMVMMYVAYPALTPHERLAGLPAIAWDRVKVSPNAALESARLARYPARFVLEMMATEPVYRIVGSDGERVSLSALDGRRIESVDAAAAVRIAEAFGGRSARLEETLERDQWTVPQGLDRFRPLYRVALDGDEGRELYVSARNGEVVRDTTRVERFWNWLGSVPHWIYFTPLRADQPLWRQVNLWVSGILMIVPVAGLVIGILRYRPRRHYHSGRSSPYRGWHRWHHVAGLVGGAFLLTWIVSGWLSVNPNRWFTERGLEADRLLEYSGHSEATFARVAPLAAGSGAFKEARFFWSLGKPRVLLADSTQVRVVDAETGTQGTQSPDALFDAARRLVPDGRLAERVVLAEDDAYWYSHHDRRPLPVLRAIFDDAHRTWVHIDPKSGAVLGTLDANDRGQRWLFNAMHQLDFPGLVQRRPVWDALMLALLSCGLVTSLSGVVIGVRRLRRSL